LNPLQVLVLSELWYPQGGGAELATSLYTERMIKAGHRVTIATNQNVTLTPGTEAPGIVRLPFGSSAAKVRYALLSELHGAVRLKSRLWSRHAFHGRNIITNETAYLRLKD
jgi:hypothetical protein